MRLIKHKHLNKPAKCRFCSARAVWQSQDCAITWRVCGGHKKELANYEAKHADKGHTTEADYHSWGGV